MVSLASADVRNYFRNSAQDYTVLDFLSARSQRARPNAAEHIRKGDLVPSDWYYGD